MIISHKHKFIFIKCYKTASTSLEIALSSICGPDDVITELQKEDLLKAKQLGYFGPQNHLEKYSNYKLKDWAKLIIKHQKKHKYAPHDSAIHIKNSLPNKIWESYFKFCFERNPWEKAISSYYYKDGEKKWGSILNFIRCGDLYYTKGFDLYSINGVVAVDKIYKLENMDESLIDLSNRLKLSKTLKLPNYHANKSKRKDKRNYKEILSEEEKSLIKIMYAREIKLLGYNF